ncbi:MAG: sulfatase [Planctomycetaceae bacterium]
MSHAPSPAPFLSRHNLQSSGISTRPRSDGLRHHWLVPALYVPFFVLFLCFGAHPNCCASDDVTTITENSPQARPNVLMIAIDDQNDWIGCLNGHPQASTPNIDHLAQRGVLFLNAHCQSPLCNPSRTSLLTGRRPSSSGVYGLAPSLRQVEVLKNTTTLPQFFRQNGYETLMAGKIYHGAYGRKKEDAEFDVVGPGSDVGARPPKPLVVTPSGHPLVDWGTFAHRDEDKGDYKLASWAVEQLQKKRDKPFFLCTGFFLPHVPCYVTQSWYDRFPEDSLILPPVLENDRSDVPRFSWYLHWKLPEPRLRFLKESGQWKNLVRSYLASTAFVDDQVGRILKALEASPYADNTIVVLWSDHGWHLGEKDITGKNTLWERSTRVPLIFAGPGVLAGGRCKEPAELLDVYPTLAELCNLPAPASQEGHSLVPQLRNTETPRPWPAITTHNHDNHGVRTRDWRYIRYADGSEELYHMTIDPNEWTNLASNPDHQAVLMEHRALLPASSVPPAPGSKDRILLYDARTGRVNWEGADVPADAPVPEL